MALGNDGLNRFFSYARERYRIMQRRKKGLSSPWTEDPVLQTYRFCNIFREDDTVTRWFRDEVRDPLRSSPDVLLATVLFRWFNRVKTGEAIFLQNLLDLGTSPAFCTDGLTAWSVRESSRDTDEWIGILHGSIKSYCGKGPYVTGAYIIKTPDGMDKLTGVLDCVRNFADMRVEAEGHKYSWWAMAQTLLEMRDSDQPVPLETVWQWLRQFPFMGDFMAYEVVTDLSHTDLLDRAPDIMTWANPGPGATRGLGRVTHGNIKAYRPSQKELLNDKMRSLLYFSKEGGYWPTEWPEWDMRTVEHTLCEFDKYERATNGEGRPRQILRST